MEKKMKKQKTNISGFRGVTLSAILLLCLGAGMVHAAVAPVLPNLRINTRPLTPAEITTYGLDSATQIANGTHVVGIGQPVYLELLVQNPSPGSYNSPEVLAIDATQVDWAITSVVEGYDNTPVSSSAAITDSPLTNLPTYNSVDRAANYVLDRAMIVPDVKGTYSISVDITTVANGTLNAQLEVVGSTFIGKDSVACTLCHQSKMDAFNETHHATAFIDQINGAGSDHFASYCIKCHVTGYDTAPGAVNGGWDDIAAQTNAQGDLIWTFPTTLSSTNWDAMPVALQNKSNIQCENCHGPAQEHWVTADPTKIGVSMSAGNCGQCHDAPSHHVKNFEWGNSLHGQTEVDRTGGCVDCHTAAGFVDANDPGRNEFDAVVPTTANFKEGITCAACHDPHAAGGQVHQLRDLQNVELSNGSVITEGGAGLVCMNCHKSRRDAESYVYGNASTHFGPHHGPQGDMLAGENAIEYGQDLPSSRHLSVVEESCAQCHMQETPDGLPAAAAGKVGGHSFMLSYTDNTGTNDVHLTETCMSCHGEIENFDFGGEDYNRDGLVEGVQTEIHHLLDELAMLLPPVGSTEIGLHTSTDGYDTLPIKRAVYNYLFVEEDGSHGVHNPKYAAAILRSSIADLKGGIDIDCDGLIDSWEIATFGDLTSQSGDDDYDDDGLTNREEYNVGTNAKVADSDGDGIWDKAELLAGSDPLDINSVPDEDLVMLPAAELAYLPKGTNSTVHFQAIDSLTDGVWSNIGPAQVSGGNWLYQLESMRTNGTQRFFRAIEE